MEQIIKLLNWSELQYSQFVYDTGLEYLHYYIPTDPHGIAALERSKIFWSWWKNHWNLRDESFIRMLNPLVGNIQMFYKHIHNPRKLSGRIWPSAVVLDESYAVMIDEFNKAQTNEYAD